MASLATPGANALLDGTALPATLYAQLHTGNPGTNGTANVATVTTRQSFTRTAAAGGVSENASLIEWSNYPTSETITHVSIWSLAVGGVCWFIGNPADVTPTIGDNVQIAAGALDLVCPLWT